MTYSSAEDLLVLGGRSFRFRLLVGAGKCASFALMKEALEKSQAEIAYKSGRISKKLYAPATSPFQGISR
jgi:thiazole synthase ThiGH ThiG subunit